MTETTIFIDSWRIFINSWKKSFTLEGRSNRKEFWTFQIVMGVASILGMILSFILNIEPIILFFALLLMISVVPSFSLAVRRCHDINLSGFFVLLTLIPGIGQFIYYIIIGGLPTRNEGNNYGNANLNLDKI
jgi:uncharacterized membrane protein YhaH (DUF805 family)